MISKRPKYLDEYIKVKGKECIDYSNLHWKTRKNRVAGEMLTL